MPGHFVPLGRILMGYFTPGLHFSLPEAPTCGLCFLSFPLVVDAKDTNRQATPCTPPKVYFPETQAATEALECERPG